MSRKSTEYSYQKINGGTKKTIIETKISKPRIEKDTYVTIIKTVKKFNIGGDNSGIDLDRKKQSSYSNEKYTKINVSNDRKSRVKSVDTRSSKQYDEKKCTCGLDHSKSITKVENVNINKNRRNVSSSNVYTSKFGSGNTSITDKNIQKTRVSSVDTYRHKAKEEQKCTCGLDHSKIVTQYSYYNLYNNGYDSNYGCTCGCICGCTCEEIDEQQRKREEMERKRKRDAEKKRKEEEEIRRKMEEEFRKKNNV